MADFNHQVRTDGLKKQAAATRLFAIVARSQFLHDKAAGKSCSAQEFTWLQSSSRLTQIECVGPRLDQVPWVELYGVGQLGGRRCGHDGRAWRCFVWGSLRGRTPLSAPASFIALPAPLSGSTSPNSLRPSPKRGRADTGPPKPRSKPHGTASRAHLPEPRRPPSGRRSSGIEPHPRRSEVDPQLAASSRGR
jgi:hypothetical protein